MLSKSSSPIASRSLGHASGVEVVALVVLSVLLGQLVRATTAPMGFGDSTRYLKMAQVPAEFVGSPWGYRIAVPYLAAFFSRLMGVPIVSSFAAIQLLAFSAFTTVLFIWLTREFRQQRVVAGLACLIFAYSFPAIYSLHNVVHVGLTEHLLVLLGCVAIYHRMTLWLASVIAVSCFVKESVGMILIPTYLVSTAVTGSARAALLNTGMLTIVYFALYLGLRSGVIFQGQSNLQTYASFYTAEYVHHVYAYWGGLKGAAARLTVSYGPIGLVAGAGWLLAPEQLKVMAVLPLLAICQIVLATDVERMAGVGMPILLLLAAFTLNHVKRRTAVLLTCLICGLFLVYNHITKKH